MLQKILFKDRLARRHIEKEEYDGKRMQRLQNLGLYILRFDGNYVLENINNSTENYNIKTLTRAKLILEEVYNKKIVTNKFINDLIKNIKK